MFSLPQLAAFAQLLGKDVSKELALIASTQVAIGNALQHEQQMFVSANWREIDVFLSSEKGRLAVDTFVKEWQGSLN